MNVRKNLLALVAAAAVISSVFDHNARAQAVNGSIGFHGTVTGSQGGGTSTLTFNNPMTVDIRQGDYQGIAMGTSANFAPISWMGSGNSAMLTSNNSPQWTIVSGGTTYQFSIIALQVATMILPGPQAIIAGTGITTITGAINRQPTYVSFSIQAFGEGEVFFISQPSCALGCGPVSVPETGSTVKLLGIAAFASLLLRNRASA